MIESIPAGVIDTINMTLSFVTLMALISHMVTSYKNHKEVMKQLESGERRTKSF